VSRSRLVPLALAVTLLLAVVAVAARGRPLGSGAGGRGGLPGSFWDYLYTTIVIVVVPLVFTGLFAASLIRRKQGKGRGYWQSLLISLATWAVFIALELLVVRHLKHLHLNLHQHPATETGNGVGRHGNPGTPHHGLNSTRTLRFRWGELLIILGLLVASGAAIATWLMRRNRETSHESAPEVLAAALDESLDDLRNDPDLRRAIIAAYARMETALGAAGIPRHPAEAPLEYVERALLSLDTSAEAVRSLTDLFEWARFSHHEPEPSMRDDAVDALVAVRDELHASDLELTPA
jgi:hypothetical protein